MGSVSPVCRDTTALPSLSSTTANSQEPPTAYLHRVLKPQLSHSKMVTVPDLGKISLKYAGLLAKAKKSPTVRPATIKALLSTILRDMAVAVPEAANLFDSMATAVSRLACTESSDPTSADDSIHPSSIVLPPETRSLNGPSPKGDLRTSQNPPSGGHSDAAAVLNARAHRKMSIEDLEISQELLPSPPKAENRRARPLIPKLNLAWVHTYY